MTKAELVEKMAKDAGISKIAAKAAFESFIDGVKKGILIVSPTMRADSQ